jgi:hypothetical protein
MGDGVIAVRYECGTNARMLDGFDLDAINLIVEETRPSRHIGFGNWPAAIIVARA